MTAIGGGEEPFIVKADEIDQTGTVLPPEGSSESVLPLVSENQSSQPAPIAIRTVNHSVTSSFRPPLRREGSAPPPPLQPPPPAPQLNYGPENPTDSLSLPQLKQLVSQFPKVEQTAYAFQYADSQSFAEEIDEWFQYSEQDRIMLSSSKEIFEQRWADYGKAINLGHSQDQEDFGISWLDAEHTVRLNFIQATLKDLDDSDILIRIEASEVLFYVLAGVWALTAGLTAPRNPDEDTNEEEKDRLFYNRVQMQWMHDGATLLHEASGIDHLFRYFRRLCKDVKLSGADSQRPIEDNDDNVNDYAQQRELTILMTSWYLIVERARINADEHGDRIIKDAIADLQPSFLSELVELLATLRWNEQSNVPVTKLFLLYWKSLLLILGGEDSLKEVKDVLQPKNKFCADASHPILTASPLDYHFFRQEITSKYPAYNPPPPLIPLELEHKSILPPLPNHPSRAGPSSGPFSGTGPTDTASSSIFHQPVHIATPAPSPPPSPIGPGGKAGKKQNYQTNQNFPLLYPPLDDTSNRIGGKGSSNLQDTLVSKRWEGSDVPASIIEAGQLFASRMRMTRAMKQLWKERELSMQDDRGWSKKKRQKQQDGAHNAEDTLVPSDVVGEQSEQDEVDDDDEEEDEIAQETKDLKLQAQLRAVESFYHEALPNMQSMVIVMLKTILINVQAIANLNGNLNSAGPEGNGQSNLPKTKSNMSLAQSHPAASVDTAVSDDDLDQLRLREIAHKAISGALMVMLKWFKISHILKFEYMTQLLLDSSYMPLILKFFAHQNMEDIVAQKNDRDELSFFHFCHLNSDHPPLSPTSPLPEEEAQSSEDEAMPPPILRHRRSPTSNSDGNIGPSSPSKQHFDPLSTDSTNFRMSQERQHHPPAVDELGNPLSPLPSTPIQIFSWRNFYSSINFLRILQKLTRGKSHRCLLLVQYKSSTILRKVLKVPDPMLRLYTLKLFKSQVPYCGRKWRQSNMRVITAIYLHCRPELRDEWLAGMHDSNIEGEVDEALPLEQALRALTHWWHLRRYRDVMGPLAEERLGVPGEEIKDEEQDFFVRELNELGWGYGMPGLGDDVAFGEDAGGMNGVAGAGMADGGSEIGEGAW